MVCDITTGEVIFWGVMIPCRDSENAYSSVNIFLSTEQNTAKLKYIVISLQTITLHTAVDFIAKNNYYRHWPDTGSIVAKMTG